MELFYGMGTNGEWWTSREYPSNIYNFIDIYYTENKVNIYSNMKDYSYSVRCVKD
jgi:uncharacterized protein (TIGR02145 family)